MLYCLQYSKEAVVRFLSHLDLMRALERAFRRAGLPLVFSQGFNPQPRISYAGALAVGVTSSGEYLDVELKTEISPQEIKERLNRFLPAGIKIKEVVPVKKRQKSLTSLINLARYELTIFSGDFSEKEIAQAVKQILALDSFFITRQSKKRQRKIDIRPGIFDLWACSDQQKLSLFFDLAVGGENQVRPREVLELVKKYLFLNEDVSCQINRCGLYIFEAGKLYTPLEKS